MSLLTDEQKDLVAKLSSEQAEGGCIMSLDDSCVGRGIRRSSRLGHQPRNHCEMLMRSWMQKRLFCLRGVWVCDNPAHYSLACFDIRHPRVACSGAPAGLKAVGLPVSTRDAVTLLHKSLSNAAGHNVHFRCGCGEGCRSKPCLRWWACAAA